MKIMAYLKYLKHAPSRDRETPDDWFWTIYRFFGYFLIVAYAVMLGINLERRTDVVKNTVFTVMSSGLALAAGYELNCYVRAVSNYFKIRVASKLTISKLDYLLVSAPMLILGGLSIYFYGDYVVAYFTDSGRSTHVSRGITAGLVTYGTMFSASYIKFLTEELLAQIIGRLPQLTERSVAHLKELKVLKQELIHYSQVKKRSDLTDKQQIERGLSFLTTEGRLHESSLSKEGNPDVRLGGDPLSYKNPVKSIIIRRQLDEVRNNQSSDQYKNPISNRNLTQPHSIEFSQVINQEAVNQKTSDRETEINSTFRMKQE